MLLILAGTFRFEPKYRGYKLFLLVMAKKKSNPTPPEQQAPETEFNPTPPEQQGYFTKPGYDVIDAEKDYVHVVTGRATFDRSTMDKTVHKTIQKVTPQMWEMCRNSWPKLGYLYIEMLHYPAGTKQGFATSEE